MTRQKPVAQNPFPQAGKSWGEKGAVATRQVPARVSNRGGTPLVAASSRPVSHRFRSPVSRKRESIAPYPTLPTVKGLRDERRSGYTHVTRATVWKCRHFTQGEILPNSSRSGLPAVGDDNPLNSGKPVCRPSSLTLRRFLHPGSR